MKRRTGVELLKIVSSIRYKISMYFFYLMVNESEIKKYNENLKSKKILELQTRLLQHQATM